MLAFKFRKAYGAASRMSCARAVQRKDASGSPGQAMLLCLMMLATSSVIVTCYRAIWPMPASFKRIISVSAAERSLLTKFSMKLFHAEQDQGIARDL